MDIRRKVLGEEPEDTAISYVNVGYYYAHMNDFEKAIIRIQKTLLITIDVVLSILMFSMMLCGEEISVLLVILTIVAWVHSVKWINKNEGL